MFRSVSQVICRDFIGDSDFTARRNSALTKLVCPLCCGDIKDWIIMDAARKFMNAQTRSCFCETCDFNIQISENMLGMYIPLYGHQKLILRELSRKMKAANVEGRDKTEEGRKAGWGRESSCERKEEEALRCWTKKIVTKMMQGGLSCDKKNVNKQLGDKSWQEGWSWREKRESFALLEEKEMDTAHERGKESFER